MIGFGFGLNVGFISAVPSSSPIPPACEEDCPPGDLNIIKNTIGGDKDAVFNYSLVSYPPKKPPIFKELSVVANTPNPTQPNYKGTGSISLEPGQYKIAEKARDADDWTFVDASCDSGGIPTGDGLDNVSIVSGGTVTCTFNNNGQGTLKIVTSAVGGDANSNFNYTIKRYDTSSPSATTNSLDIVTEDLIREDKLRGDELRGDKTIAADKGITVYSITQKISEKGWALNNVSCEVQYKSSAAPTGIRTQYSYGVMNVTVRGGHITTCTFQNTKKGELKIIEKGPANASGDNKFNYNINFVSTKYFSGNILPFAIDSDQCGSITSITSPPGSPPISPPTGSPPPPQSGQTCSIDEDCNICKEDCGSCSEPKPQSPGPGYSPSRMTVEINKDEIKRIYPGTYRIVEYLPNRLSEKDSWTRANIKCTLENGDETGEITAGGIQKLDVFAGKTTTCTFSHTLTTPTQNPGGGGGRLPKEPSKPTSGQVVP